MSFFGRARTKAKFSWFNDISIQKKIILSYVLVVLLPVLLVGSTLTSGMRGLSLDWALHEATVNVDRVKKRITDMMRISIVISNKFFIDRSLEDILERRYSSTWDVVKTYWDYRTLDEYPNLYNEISMIRAYSTNPTILENWRIMKVTPEISQSSWYQNALDNKGKINWAYISFPELGKEYFSLVRSITGIKSVGVLTISINPDFLHDILSQESFETLLIDDRGYIIAASDRDLVGQSTEELMLGEINSDDLIQELYYRGALCKVISSRISPEENYGSLRIASIFPVAQIVDQANKASRLGLVIIGASLLLSFLLILVLSRILSERIQILSSGAHRVAAGDLSYSLEVEGKDEIGQLSTDLNLMIRNIQGLLREVYEVNLQKKQLEIEQRDIKLKMLSNQINPHFLFNVLETIRMKAHTNGEEGIAQIVKMLGKMLRRNLEMNTELAPLATELDLVVSYLEIQKFRFGEKLEYRLEVAEDTKEYPLLPLIIQPLVENAVVHGLENKEEKGLVTLNTYLTEESLHILVRDNGTGMDQMKLESLMASITDGNKKETKHVALKNTYQRLRLFYGEDFAFRMESRPNQGTEVEIILPRERDEKNA